MGYERELSVLPFDGLRTRDNLGRLVTFYVSPVESLGEKLPLAVFVQGSGCHSVFRKHDDGCLRGRYQSVLLQVAKRKARVMIVEKPGVSFLDDPGPTGTAEQCSEEFLREHTLLRWAEALRAAVRAAQALPNISGESLLAIGHSEGGITAATLAAEHAFVSHVAVLSSNGPTQLFDLVCQARAQRSPDEAPEKAEERVNDIYETFKRIVADPESITKFAWGHPYRRWSSFLATSTLDELLRSKARVYLAHASRDSVVPVAAFEVLRAELVRHRRDVTAELCEGADHGFRMGGRRATEPMAELLARVVDWFAKDVTYR